MKMITLRQIGPFVMVGLLVALGIATGMIIAPVRAQSTYASIGYVDVQEALSAHPDLQDVLTQIQQYEDAKLEELAEYGSLEEMTEAEREQFMQDIYRIQDEVDAERQRLTEPLIQDVIDATTAIGHESGIEVILEAGAVMWGGLNLTPLIVEQLQAM